jgi:hypothetical protein
MKKISAVEWLFQELWETPQDKFRWHTILQQAIEMEKEQIRRAFCHGEVARDRIDSMEYYNETYGK